MTKKTSKNFKRFSRDVLTISIFIILTLILLYKNLLLYSFITFLFLLIGLYIRFVGGQSD